jgi:biopolymer transport protein ExbD
MKLTRTVSHNPAIFGLIPFVNVLFLVLMFFTLSSRFVLQPGIGVSLPVSAFTLGPQRNPQILSITSGPVPKIYFRDRALALGELGAALRAERGKDRTLIVRADRLTPYDLIVQVTNVGLQAGFSVVLATSPSSTALPATAAAAERERK